MTLHAIVKTTGSYALYYSGAVHLYSRLRGAGKRPVILGLHRVVENFQDSAVDAMAPMLISVAILEQYLDWIGRWRKFVTLEEAADQYDHPRASGKPLAAVTLDDGYSDVYYHAFPLLRRKGIPFAVFPVTNLVGTDRLQTHDELFLLLRRVLERWGTRSRTRFTELFERLNIGRRIDLGVGDAMPLTRLFLHALPRSELLTVIAALRDAVGPIASAPHLRSLTWPMIKEMHAAGVTIGSHGTDHVLLSREPLERIVAEAVNSKRAIEAKIGTPVTQFAYPDGKFNTTVVAALAESGYQAAYTTCAHRNRVWPALTIPRLMLWEKACMDARARPSPAVLECLLGGLGGTLGAAGRCRESHAA